ncbi:hypothetical protein EJ066_17380 [Mesorhizobium sp. M9A.F.Ca.ET.002.03.1.2]|uniref:acyltransferase family protein n=1 Tax=Mesorhizobium sp. M9A.F.Ca.ET.002.03.1.2 TaxID=2493668 RepID=UPI000F7518F9|nr:acyltransferase family protein [Mesorhizobium sp. M9A.F.Ca.ET.002.03.1.2]AZN98785.1 hypothetical protein EJ066_17380 [Mesorhizobium sp. M9A.F.Ca.ET.002.03.1.2]
MERNAHYLIIDFLRIFAAILVLLNHFATFAWNSASVAEGSDVGFGFLSAFAGLGAVGVEIFFVISGFVIAMSASGEGGCRKRCVSRAFALRVYCQPCGCPRLSVWPHEPFMERICLVF